MRTKSCCIIFGILVFFIHALPFPAGAVVDWTNRTETNLVPGLAGAWDDDQIAAPNVIKDGSIYKMWYSGKSSTGPYQIGYATSSDGIAWTKHGANPIISPAAVGTWDSLPVQHVVACTVLKTGSTYEMWYTGLTGHPDTEGSNPQIGYATSSDGIAWTHHGSPVLTKGAANEWDSGGIWAPTVIKDHGTYEMWYTAGDQYNGIGFAESPDGSPTNWVKYNNPATTTSPYVNSDPVIKLGPTGSWNGDRTGTPTVIKEDNKHNMWFYGASGAPGSPEDTRPRIGYAYNTVGSDTSWRLYSGNPLLHPGATGAFDDGGVMFPSVIKDGNTYRMWYSNGNAASDKLNKIGYTEAHAYQGDTLSFGKVNVATRYELTRSGLQFLIRVRGRSSSPSFLDITSCTVSGPGAFNGGNPLMIGDSSIFNSEGEQIISYFFLITGGVTSSHSGTYTFTVKTNNGLTATTTIDLAVSPITVPNQAQLDPYVETASGTNIYAGTTTPTLKWKPFAGDNYYYRVQVVDWKQGAGWYTSDYVLGSSKGGDGYMSVTIPAGYLKPDTPYKWKINIADAGPSAFSGSFNRVDSDYYSFYTGTKGTANFLSGVIFQRMESYTEGRSTLMAAAVVNLAPWNIAISDPNKFRVENEASATYYAFVLSTDALTWDLNQAPFAYYKVLNSPSIADTSGLGYKFFVSDGSSSSQLYATYVNPSGAKPQLTREQMTPRDNAYLQTLQPTLTWKSDGTAYRYRVLIFDWNNLRQVYSGSFLDGLAAGQDMSITVPAGILRESSPYRWFVEIFDSGLYNRFRTELLSFKTPSLDFLYASFASGIWKWDSSAWSQITQSVPENMVATGSILYCDFGPGGIWKWDGSAWSQITQSNPESIRVTGHPWAPGSILYGDFGPGGIWKWDGSAWSQITQSDPEGIRAYGSILYGDFGTGGIWKWDGSAWSQITQSDPESIRIWGGSILYGDFGQGGIWQWNGSVWSQMTQSDPQNMVSADTAFYGYFGAGGIWQWDGNSWSQITQSDPQSMTSAGSTLYCDFETGGIWKWDGSAWSQITQSDPLSITGS